MFGPPADAVEREMVGKDSDAELICEVWRGSC